jgi:mevalonate pyrophosphate decarboxylase
VIRVPSSGAPAFAAPAHCFEALRKTGQQMSRLIRIPLGSASRSLGTHGNLAIPLQLPHQDQFAATSGRYGRYLTSILLAQKMIPFAWSRRVDQGHGGPEPCFRARSGFF